MRIAQIAPFYGDEIGGAENSTSLSLAYLREQGVNFSVFSMRECARRRGAHVIPFLNWMPATVASVGNPVLDVIVSKLLLRALVAQGPFDLIHAQDVVFLCSSVVAAEESGIPLVVTVRDPLPRSIDCNNYPCLLAYTFSPLLKHQDVKRLSVMNRCAKIIAISKFMKGLLVSQGVFPERIEVIYNPIGSMFTETRIQRIDQGSEHWQLDRPLIHLLAAGRLYQEKGFHVLLQALPRVVTQRPDVRVTIAGTGPQEKRLRSLARRLDLDRYVRFAGQVPFREMAAMYAQADIVVVPSVFSEPMGRTVLEAMSQGKAIIASAVGAIPELVDDGVSGWLVPPSNPEALSEAMLTLLSDHDLRRSLGETGRQYVVESFDDSRIIRQVIGVYQHAMGD